MNKLHVKDKRLSIHQSVKNLSDSSDAPMLVTHWMESGIGTLGRGHPAAVWKIRLSCPKPLSETGHGQNDHMSPESRQGAQGMCEGECWDSRRQRILCDHVHMCNVFRNGAVWVLTMRGLLDGAVCTTFDGDATCAHEQKRLRSRTWVQMRKMQIGPTPTRPRHVQATSMQPLTEGT